eukprot:scaffold89960_cov57-Phaeocystis_antarctica.AAC.2
MEGKRDASRALSSRRPRRRPYTTLTAVALAAAARGCRLLPTYLLLTPRTYYGAATSRWVRTSTTSRSASRPPPEDRVPGTWTPRWLPPHGTPCRDPFSFLHEQNA